MEDKELVSTYEVAIVITPDLSEFDVQKVMDKVRNSIIGKNGSVQKEHTWGKKRLAYPIGKAEYGHYQSIVFTGLKEVLAEIDKDIRLMPEIIRHLIISLEKEGITVDQLFTPEKEVALLAAMAKEKSEPTTHAHQTRASRGRITPKVEVAPEIVTEEKLEESAPDTEGTPDATLRTSDPLSEPGSAPEGALPRRETHPSRRQGPEAIGVLDKEVEEKRREELDKKLDELLKE